MDLGSFSTKKCYTYLLFLQPLIPAVAAEDGHWLISEPLGLILKPGGHGVIWKLAFDRGVFDWFYKKGRKAALVRQIRLERFLMFRWETHEFGCFATMAISSELPTSIHIKIDDVLLCFVLAATQLQRRM